MLSPITLLLSLFHRGAERENYIWVTHGVAVAHEIGVKYKIEVTYETKQVKSYLGFLKTSGFIITNKNKSLLISISFFRYV
jgi:hypothetical protein